MRWLITVGAMLLLGNLGAFFLTWYLTNLNLSLGHLAPWLFLVVPVAGIIMSVKGGILAKDFRYRTGAIALVAVHVLVWLEVVYMYLMNVYPDVF